MNLNQTVYVPHCGEKPEKLRPYWIGARSSMAAASLVCEQESAKIAEQFGMSSIWKVQEHQLGEIPAHLAPYLPDLFPRESFTEKHIICDPPYPECMDCNKISCEGCQVPK